MIYALWSGGSSYSGPTMDDVESFPSIKAAARALRDRAANGYWERQTFNYVNREPERTLTPCAYEDSGTCMDVYRADPTESMDPYPDLRLEFGPRGGVVRSSF